MISDAIARLTAKSLDVLLIYYVGHGIVGDDNHLRLATSSYPVGQPWHHRLHHLRHRQPDHESDDSARSSGALPGLLQLQPCAVPGPFADPGVRHLLLRRGGRAGARPRGCQPYSVQWPPHRPAGAG
ncbi:hypothetical protein ACRAWF_07690 [Streptomyces sp. L7]